MSIADFLATVHADHERVGWRSGNCADCYPEPPTSWHDDARAGRLRPAIVGGLPLDLDPTAVGSPVSRPAASGTGAIGTAQGISQALAQQPTDTRPGRGHSLAGWTPGELQEAFGR